MNWKYPLSALAISALLVGCNQSDNANKSASNDIVETKEEAIIKDELNRQITVPMNPARVVVGGILPYFSTWYIATNSTQEIVGMHPNSYNAASHSILKDISPDIIYITNFTETQPKDLFNNSIQGQDWSQLKAVQNKQVYKVPLGIYRWYPSNGDAPLMLKWISQHNHPEIFNYNMTEEIQQYYTKFYNYDVTEEQVHDILNPSSEAARY